MHERGSGRHQRGIGWVPVQPGAGEAYGRTRRTLHQELLGAGAMSTNFPKTNFVAPRPQLSFLLPGQFRFNPGRKLGQGGLGYVDEITIVASSASDLPVGTKLARKRLNENFKTRPEARERFEREIRALATMSHPNIVTVEGQNAPGGERCYMMPLYPNNLRNHLAAHPTGFSWTSVALFIAKIADAMTYAHEMRFIHRDLKPENILLTQENEPVIADWGLGYFIHKESKVLQHLTQGCMGTEYYCSMEQWNTGKCSQTGDIYSLGMMLAELIKGYQVPMVVPGLTGTGIAEDVVLGSTHGARMLNNLIRKMTHISPESRPQSMADVALQLRMAVAFANA
nr:serine/threonine-protein kinase [Corallococcus sp. CA054B]